MIAVIASAIALREVRPGKWKRDERELWKDCYDSWKRGSAMLARGSTLVSLINEGKPASEVGENLERQETRSESGQTDRSNSSSSALDDIRSASRPPRVTVLGCSAVPLFVTAEFRITNRRWAKMGFAQKGAQPPCSPDSSWNV